MPLYAIILLCKHSGSGVKRDCFVNSLLAYISTYVMILAVPAALSEDASTGMQPQYARYITSLHTRLPYCCL